MKLLQNVYLASILWSVGTGYVAGGMISFLFAQVHMGNPHCLSPLLLYWLVGAGLIVDKERTNWQRLVLPVISYLAFWVGVGTVAFWTTVHTPNLLAQILRITVGIESLSPFEPNLNSVVILLVPMLLLGLLITFRSKRKAAVQMLGCGKHGAPVEVKLIAPEVKPGTADGGGVIYVKEAVHETI